MPSKNTVREDADDMYYHVYNRCISDSELFRDDDDYVVFLSLLKRYLQLERTYSNTNGKYYDNFYNEIHLLAFCLMPSHFHMLFYQTKAGDLAKLMQAISNSYTRYYNIKYKRRGPIFQGKYKASRISNDEYLSHISRYIHLNADNYNEWSWSSLPYYKGNFHADWIQPQLILDLFNNNQQEYLKFVADYEEMHAYLEKLHHDLADLADTVPDY